MSEVKELKIGRVVFPICKLATGRFVAWWKEGSRRRRVTGVTVEKLKDKLSRIAVNILNGEIDAANLDASDHRAYRAAREALAPWKIPVDAVAREYAAARELLGDVSVLDAIRFYKRHAGVEIIERSVSAAVVEFLASLSSQTLSPEYQRQCRQDLGGFVKFAGEKLCSEVTVTMIDQFLDTCGRRRRQGKEIVFTPASNWRRNQIRNTLATLFRFARDRKYLLPERKTQAEFVKRRKVVRASKPVWAPPILKRALETVAEHYPHWLPWIAISAFTGMRTGAILKLRWNHVHWDSALIEVGAANSKVNTRFVARMRPALLSWLAPWRNKTGPVCERKDVGEFTELLRDRYGLPYVKNVFRHSYISYRLAECGNIDVTADETNTSPGKIRTNYREIHAMTGELVTPALAEEWLSLAPKQDEKIIQPTFKFA